MKNTTESREMYLKTIYLLSKRNGDVHNIDIALELGFSKPSVTNMLKTLAADGDLVIDSDNHVHLTPDGYKHAEKIYERYTTFVELLKIMGVPSDKIHDAACKLEHGVDDEVFECMKVWLEKH